MTKKKEKPEFRFVEDKQAFSGYSIIWKSGTPIPASNFEAGVYEAFSGEIARLRAENAGLTIKVKELEDALRAAQRAQEQTDT